MLNILIPYVLIDSKPKSMRANNNKKKKKKKKTQEVRNVILVLSHLYEEM